MDKDIYIKRLSKEYEERIRRIPFLNIDAFIIPSPYIAGHNMEKDYEHSYLWEEEGEILGYILTYSNTDKTFFHIYKQVTSPFGRGKGIGSAFLEKLVNEVSEDAIIYLYVWEKRIDSLMFFENKGFRLIDSIVYRNLVFHHLQNSAGNIKKQINIHKSKLKTQLEEIGKMRHDAKKILKLLIDKVNLLSIDNTPKVIEDINRETTALINILNTYEDKIELYKREVNLRNLITERIIPYIEVSGVNCKVIFTVETPVPPVIAHYIDVGRALINIISNSLDAIKEAGRDIGVIEITLRGAEEFVYLDIKDNGIGIPKEKLRLDKNGIPLFVGRTTKKSKKGTGTGTVQVFETFGKKNIVFSSKYKQYTKVTIRFPKKIIKTEDNKFEYQMFEFRESNLRMPEISDKSDYVSISTYIWELRKMEVFLYDLLFQFSEYNNIRNIYRQILAVRYGDIKLSEFEKEIFNYRIDNLKIPKWVIEVLEKILIYEKKLYDSITITDRIRGVLLKSYGQALGRTIIFTIDPESGNFYATDRKLAEHLDFAPYLGKSTDELIRGEFKGDINNLKSPLYLGVWTIKDNNDLLYKLELLRKTAEKLIDFGINRNKRLSFYHTTYNQYSVEINTYKITTLKEFSGLNQEKLLEFTDQADEQLQGLIFAD